MAGLPAARSPAVGRALWVPRAGWSEGWACGQPGEERGLTQAVLWVGVAPWRLPTHPRLSISFQGRGWPLGSFSPGLATGPGVRQEAGMSAGHGPTPGAWALAVLQGGGGGECPGRATSPARNRPPGTNLMPAVGTAEMPPGMEKSPSCHLVFILGQGPGANGRSLRVVRTVTCSRPSTPGSPVCD